MWSIGKYVKSNNGAALALVLIVMFVLILLGTTYASSSVFTYKHSIREYNSMQAKYLAQSGVEASIGYVSQYMQNNSGTIPYGVSTMYLNSDNILETSPTKAVIGQFTVNVEPNTDGSIDINSKGTFNGVNQVVKANVLVNTRTVTLNSSATPMGGVWYDNTSGHIMSDVSHLPQTTPVIVNPNSALKSTHVDTTFKAPYIIIESSMHNIKKELKFKSDVIVFVQTFKLHKDGSIILDIYDVGFEHNGSPHGKVYYNNNWYWFPAGCNVNNISDIESLDIIVNSFDQPQSSNPTVQTVYDLSVRWL